MSEERLLESSEAQIELERDSFIQKARVYAFPTTNLEPHEYIREDCMDCGEDLELFRKQKGRSRCVGCQQIFELKRAKR